MKKSLVAVFCITTDLKTFTTNLPAFNIVVNVSVVSDDTFLFFFNIEGAIVNHYSICKK